MTFFRMITTERASEIQINLTGYKLFVESITRPVPQSKARTANRDRIHLCSIV